MIVSILLVAGGSALGGIARFWLSGVVSERFGTAFPWGILVVNVSGALSLGMLAGFLGQVPVMADVTGRYPPPWLALGVGLLGSYTTVSTFSQQTLDLVHGGYKARALAYVAASLAGCLTVGAVGVALGLTTRAVAG